MVVVLPLPNSMPDFGRLGGSRSVVVMDATLAKARIGTRHHRLQTAGPRAWLEMMILIAAPGLRYKSSSDLRMPRSKK